MPNAESSQDHHPFFDGVSSSISPPGICTTQRPPPLSSTLHLYRHRLQLVGVYANVGERCLLVIRPSNTTLRPIFLTTSNHFTILYHGIRESLNPAILPSSYAYSWDAVDHGYMRHPVPLECCTWYDAGCGRSYVVHAGDLTMGKICWFCLGVK